MEREHLYSQVNHLSRTAPTLIRRDDTKESAAPVNTVSIRPATASKPAIVRTLQPTVVEAAPIVPVKSVITEVLTPSIKNTGIAGGTEIKPNASTTLSQPKTAETPYILQANVPGGMVVEKPSVVNTIATSMLKPGGSLAPSPIAEAFKAGTLTKETADIMTKQATQRVDETPADSDNKQAGGFSLPNIGIMLAMIAAVIVMFYLGRKKKP